MDQLLDFSDRFELRSGAVLVDISKRSVLLYYCQPKEVGLHILDPTEKNVGETLEAAAIRGAEVSGLKCHLFKHQLVTNAREVKASPHTEPFAVQQVIHEGVRRILFWFVAVVDEMSGMQKESDKESDKELDIFKWVRMEDAVSTCSRTHDKRIVEKALEAVNRASSLSASLWII